MSTARVCALLNALGPSCPDHAAMLVASLLLSRPTRRVVYSDEYSKVGAKPPESFVRRLPPKRT